MSRICTKEFLELNWLNVYVRYLQFFVFDILNLELSVSYLNEVFCPVDYNGVAMHSCNKKWKLPFRKLKLGMQSLSYV